MPSNAASFMKRMTGRANQVRLAEATIAKEAAIAALRTAALTTPVDTGAAQSNWLVTINNRTDAIIPAFRPNPRGEHTKGPSEWAGDTSNAVVAIEIGETIINSMKGGGEIVIQNNVPYIERLNDGSLSTQSHDMLEFAMQDARTRIKNLFILGA